MAKQNIVIGAANAGGGDTYFTASEKTVANFNELYDAANVADIATFKQPATWVNTPLDPATGTIQLSTVDAVSGAVAAVYFKGTTLSFSGGTVVIQSGEIIVDELCIIWIIYDKLNLSFHVNIQTGATGSAPPVGDVLPPAKMEITSLQGDEITPAKMIITSII